MLANDRFKFRAWHTVTNTMLSYEDVQESLSSLGWDDALTDLILMQTTGIHDANGVMIYEGDIILDREDRDNDCDTGVWVVLWHEPQLTFMFDEARENMLDPSLEKLHPPLDRLSDSLSDTDIVIGNVFENKELLV